MTKLSSLQARLAVSLGVILTVLWGGAAWVTVVTLRHEMDQVFDSALQETAQRLLPLAVLDIVGREDQGATQRLGAIRAHDEFFTYIVRDAQGRILLRSHAADPSVFPVFDGPGFGQTQTHRLYSEDALRGSVRITVAEPLAQRADVALDLQMVLGLPILIVIPFALLAIVLAVRSSLAPLRRFQESLSQRTERDLSPILTTDLPTELSPVALTLNGVLQRLQAAFDAERSFAANAAHELRTPLAGAIAQAQRLQSETLDATAAKRGADIEASLKRLTRMAESLLQLARAEGGPLRLGATTDLRVVARLIVNDLARAAPKREITLSLPDHPVHSDVDPDVFGIVCQNLTENAIRHGVPDRPVLIRLDKTGTLCVANDGPVIPASDLARLTQRFSRGTSTAKGSGLGLAIVAAIADRMNMCLTLRSPRSGSTEGFEASLTFPVGLS